VSVRKVLGDTSKHFLGDLGVREGQGATFTLDREKHLHPNHDVIIITAARLLGANPGTSLVVGLPVAYYRRQTEEMSAPGHQGIAGNVHRYVDYQARRLSTIKL